MSVKFIKELEENDYKMGNYITKGIAVAAALAGAGCTGQGWDIPEQRVYCGTVRSGNITVVLNSEEGVRSHEYRIDTDGDLDPEMRALGCTHIREATGEQLRIGRQVLEQMER